MVHLMEKYPDLADLIARWPNLPKHIRAAVMALVTNAKT